MRSRTLLTFLLLLCSTLLFACTDEEGDTNDTSSSGGDTSSSGGDTSSSGGDTGSSGGDTGSSGGDTSSSGGEDTSSGGEDVTLDDLTDAYDAFAMATEESIALECTCRGDESSDVCTSDPDLTCYATEEACVAEERSEELGPEGAEDCLIAALEMDLEGSAEVIECEHAARTTHIACMGDVMACDSEAFGACDDALGDAKADCPNISEAVETAIESCFE